jgi:hypothetical protein
VGETPRPNAFDFGLIEPRAVSDHVIMLRDAHLALVPSPSVFIMQAQAAKPQEVYKILGGMNLLISLLCSSS